jgi:hypothetical protein
MRFLCSASVIVAMAVCREDQHHVVNFDVVKHLEIDVVTGFRVCGGEGSI